MIIKNEFDLPESIANALKADNYDLTNAPGNIISVTSLIKAPKNRILTKKHWEQLETDILDRVRMFSGNAFHALMESSNIKLQQADPQRVMLIEQRWCLDVTDGSIYIILNHQRIEKTEWYNAAHWYVSGKLDCYINKIIEDYKETSVWSYIYEPEGNKEYQQQINIHAYALRQLKYPVESGRLILKLYDWSVNKVGQGNYPTISIQTIPVLLKTDDEVLTYIKKRVQEHIAYVAQPDNDIPHCTPEERWYQKGKLAVMKDGNKKATKLFEEDERPQAKAFISKQTKGTFHIESRPGVNRRCESYCDCNKFCSFYQENLLK